MHSERFDELPEKLDSKMAQFAFSTSNPYFPLKSEITYVKLRFHIDAVDKVLDKFGFAIQMIPDGDRFFTTTVAVEPTNDFFGWMFSMGTNAEILEPAIVRGSMAFKLMMASGRYNRKYPKL